MKPTGNPQHVSLPGPLKSYKADHDDKINNLTSLKYCVTLYQANVQTPALRTLESGPNNGVHLRDPQLGPHTLER